MQIYMVSATEESKSIDYLCSLLNGIYSITPAPMHLVTFGGTLQDASGFVAGLIRRGIDWTFIPTTLLGMADSSIGSKISVTLAKRKINLASFMHLRRSSFIQNS